MMNEEKPRYTGVGAHFGTPKKVLEDIFDIAVALEELGYVCRTGDADECDKAFRNGVQHKENIEIYARGAGTLKSIDMVYKLHPNPGAARRYIRWLGRNPLQVAGKDLDDSSKFLITWTPDGAMVGGAGFTICVADYFHVPVMNLFQYTKEDVIEIARLVKDGKYVAYKTDIREIVGDLGGLLKY